MHCFLLLCFALLQVTSAVDVRVAFAHEYNDPSSGVASTTDLFALPGYKLAIEDINASPDLEGITLVDTGEFDTKCDDVTSFQAFLTHQTSVEGGLHAVVGATCAGAQPGVGGLGAVLGIPVVTGGVTTIELEDRETFSTFYGVGPRQSEVAQWWIAMCQHYNWTKVQIMAPINDKPTALFASIAPEHGIEVVNYKSFLPGDTAAIASMAEELYSTSVSVLILVVELTDPFTTTQVLLSLIDAGFVEPGRVVLGDDVWMTRNLVSEASGELTRKVVPFLEGVVGVQWAVPSSFGPLFQRFMAYTQAQIDADNPEYESYKKFANVAVFYTKGLYSTYDATFAIAIAAKQLLDQGQDVSATNINTVLSTLSYTGLEGNPISLRLEDHRSVFQIANIDGGLIAEKGEFSSDQGIKLANATEMCEVFLRDPRSCKIRFAAGTPWRFEEGTTRGNGRYPNTTIVDVREEGEWEELPDPVTVACIPGYEEVDSACIPCWQGHYRNSSSTSCLPCPRGYYASEGGQSACIACEPGTFAASEGQDRCNECGHVHYSPATGSTSCTSCPPFSTTCVVTADGEMCEQKAQHASQCFCGPGYYGDLTKSGGQCRWCPPGGSCCMCDEVFPCWNNTDSTECFNALMANLGQFGQSCSGVCVSGVTEPIATPGFYQNFLEDEEDDSLAVQIVECSEPSACLGGPSGHSQCSEGYSGVRCGVCRSDYYMLSGVCHKCPAGYAVLGVLLWLVPFFFVAYVIRAAARWFRSASITVFIDMCQTLSIVRLMSIPWESALRSLFDFLSLFNLNLNLLAPECTFGVSYWEKFALVMAAPFIVGGLSAMVLLVVYVRARGSIHTEKLRQHLSEWLSLIINGNLIFLSTAHTMISLKTTEPFRCSEYGSTSLWMKESPHQECFGDEWWSFFPLILFGVLLYYVGYPILVFLIIRKYRHSLDDRWVKRTFGSVYIMYRKSSILPYFEVWSRFKKAFLIFLLTTSDNELGLEAFWVCTILLIDMMVTFMRPFRLDTANNTRIISGFVTFIVFCVGVAAAVDGDNEGSKAGFAVFAVIVLVLWMVASLHTIVAEAIMFYGYRSQKLQTPKAEMWLRRLKLPIPEHKRHWAVAEQMRSQLDSDTANAPSSAGRLWGIMATGPAEAPDAARRRRFASRSLSVSDIDSMIYGSEAIKQSYATLRLFHPQVEPYVQDWFHGQESIARRSLLTALGDLVRYVHENDLEKVLGMDSNTRVWDVQKLFDESEHLHANGNGNGNMNGNGDGSGVGEENHVSRPNSSGSSQPRHDRPPSQGSTGGYLASEM